jgi:isopentenyl-diphosphate delta-isomerase
LGFNCHLRELFAFTYQAQLDNYVVEYEYDHVFVGQFEGEFVPHPEEVDEWRWVWPDDLKTGIRVNPREYTAWLKICFNDVMDAVSVGG